MRILVTGNTGQVGYELVRSLQGLGEIVAPGRAQMDLSRPDQVRDVIRAIKPDLIVNPAAYTAVDKAESEAALAMLVNGESPAVMAEEAKKLGAAMIHFSTDYVFDGTKPGPYNEQDAPCPVNEYGRSKLAGEQAILAAGIPHFILRTSWVYGMRGKNFLLTIQRLARERDELTIVADQYGSPTWSRMLAGHTAHMVAQLASAGRADGKPPAANDRWLEHSGLYHLTAQGKTSWHGFAQAIVDQSILAKKPAVKPIATADYPTPARRPPNSMLDCGRWVAAFGAPAQWDVALKLCLEQ